MELVQQGQSFSLKMDDNQHWLQGSSISVVAGPAGVGVREGWQSSMLRCLLDQFLWDEMNNRGWVLRSGHHTVPGVEG